VAVLPSAGSEAKKKAHSCPYRSIGVIRHSLRRGRRTDSLPLLMRIRSRASSKQIMRAEPRIENCRSPLNFSSIDVHR
jgi:hypothetical protein